MNGFRFLIVSLLALTIGGLLAACQRTGDSDIARTDDGVMRLGSVEVVDTVARAVAPTGRPLVLEGLRGSVHLTGTDQTTADLSFVRRGRGDSQADGQSVLEGISITESGTEAEYTYTLAADQDNYAAVDIRGQVPRSAALQIDRLSGAVHIQDVEGALTIDHQHGDVDVQRAAAPVEATIRNGDVQVVFQSVPAEGEMLLETANGDIDLGLPPNASAQIDAQTDVGTIRTQGLSFSAEQFAPINAGARYDAEIGEDGPTIELRTQNGSITLRGVAPTDTADTTSAPATVPSTDTTMAPQPDADTVDTMDTDTMSVDTTAADSVF
jgi:hypothetical protein